MIVPFVLAFAAAPQTPLTNLRTTTEPAYGTRSAISDDGDTLYWMQGHQLKHVDLTIVRDNELNNQNQDPVVQIAQLDAGCTSLIEDSAGGRLFIGAADYGVYVQDTSTAGNPTPVDLNTGGRWVHGLAIDGTGDYLLAVFGGLDASQLRVYDISGAPTLVNTLPIDVASGLVRESIAYAVDVHGPYAYIAVGRSGLARIRWNAPGPVLGQGYDPVPAGDAGNPSRSVAYRTIDLDIEGDFLFAASNGGGLVRVDLSATGWPTGTNATVVRPHRPQSPQDPNAHFPVRVDATLNPTNAEILVAVGTLPRPDAAHQWGPYDPATSFAFDLGNAVIEPGFHPPFGSGSDEGLFIFSQPIAGGALVEQRDGFIEGNSNKKDWKSLAAQFVPSTGGRIWVYDGDFHVWNARRRTNGTFTPLVESPAGRYVSIYPDYSGGLQSKQNPNIVLSGADGRENPLPLYRATDDPATSQPVFYRVSGTTDLPHRLGLLVQDSWLDSGSEWVPGPQGDSAATVGGEESWKIIELTTGATGFNSWKEAYLDFPVDPLSSGGTGTFLNGRSYATVAVDHRTGSELLAAGRTGVQSAVALYMRSDVQIAMNAVAAGAHFGLTPLAHLNTAPELAAPHTASENHNLRMEFFDIGSDEAAKRFLMVVAGYDLSGIAGQDLRPKLVFFDVTSCLNPGNCNIGQIGAPIVATGNGPQALAFGGTTADINGTTYGFAGDALGYVTAFDLTNLLSGTAPAVAGTFYVGASILDGLSAPVIDIKFREELIAGNLESVMYLAASREGIVRVQVDEATPGSLTMTEVGRIPTPGQASTLALGQMTLAGSTVDTMVVFDHGQYGIQLYTE